MNLHCTNYKKETLHREVTRWSRDSEPFKYFVCSDCGEPYLTYSKSDNESYLKENVNKKEK